MTNLHPGLYYGIQALEGRGDTKRAREILKREITKINLRSRYAKPRYFPQTDIEAVFQAKTKATDRGHSYGSNDRPSQRSGGTRRSMPLPFNTPLGTLDAQRGKVKKDNVLARIIRAAGRMI